MTSPEDIEASAYERVVRLLEEWEKARSLANLERERFILTRPVGENGRLNYPEKWLGDPADFLELQAAILRETRAWDALQKATKGWHQALDGLPK